jgi:hypothetical protein
VCRNDADVDEIDREAVYLLRATRLARDNLHKVPQSSANGLALLEDVQDAQYIAFEEKARKNRQSSELLEDVRGGAGMDR